MTETTQEVCFMNFKEIEGIIKFMAPNDDMDNFSLSQYLTEKGLVNDLVNYLIDNPDYSGFITVKYKFEEDIKMYMGDRYLMDIDWRSVEHWIPPIHLMEWANKDYLENKHKQIEELEPLIINRNHRHNVRHLLNKKINNDNVLDEIMKFI